MAQREQHERVKRMDRLADKLFGHKAVVMAILVVIAMASGLAMANLGGGAGGVSFERTDGSGSLGEPGSGDASSGKTSEGSSAKASAAAEVYVDVDGAVVSPGVYRLKDGARVAQAIDAAGGLTLRGLTGHPRSLMDKKSTFQRWGSSRRPLRKPVLMVGLPHHWA